MPRLSPAATPRAHRESGRARSQEFVDLLGAFLLDPVAAAVEDVGGRQAGQGRGVGLDGAGEPGGRGVEFPSGVQGRLSDRRPVPGGEVLPVAVDVAVAVERSGQAGPFEFGDVEVQVIRGKPAGQGVVGEVVGHAPARGDDERGRGVRLAGECRVDPAEPGADVGFDLGLGAAGALEVADVELPRVTDRGVGVGGPAVAARRVGDAEQADGGEQVGA
jgi:hypothetical protein